MIMSTTIFESGLITPLSGIGFDTAFNNVGKVLFTSGQTGNVSVVFEGGTTAILPVEVIQDGHPRVIQINSSGTTVLIADIYIGFQ